MQRILIFAAVLISYFLISDADKKFCDFKKPMDDFKTEYLYGTLYAVAEKGIFDIQNKLKHCGRIDSTNVGDDDWILNFTYENSNGKVFNKTHEFENSPPGYFTAFTSNKGGCHLFTVLGAKINSYVVAFFCDFENGSDAFIIYTRRRVNGYNSLDEETRNEIETILRNNNLDTSGLQMVDNSNCYN